MSDLSSLPLFAPTADPGPSFADLLRQVAPHQLPGAGVTAPITLDVPHGTTVVAIRYANGVVMAGDRRATAGYTIASRRIEKVFPADDFSGVVVNLRTSGTWGPLGHNPDPFFPAPQLVHAAAHGRAPDLSGVRGRQHAEDSLDLCPRQVGAGIIPPGRVVPQSIQEDEALVQIAAVVRVGLRLRVDERGVGE